MPVMGKAAKSSGNTLRKENDTNNDSTVPIENRIMPVRNKPLLPWVCRCRIKLPGPAGAWGAKGALPDGWLGKFWFCMLYLRYMI